VAAARPMPAAPGSRDRLRPFAAPPGAPYARSYLRDLPLLLADRRADRSDRPPGPV